jgi:selenocysteine lyase/cysteine desulfurase
MIVPKDSVRAPHILCVRFPGGMPERLIERLAAEQVYVAARIGRMRVSPHVYNDEEDIGRFLAAFHSLTCGTHA